MQCPKCRGTMRTHNRHNVHIEQCDNCRGIFLDYGELETLSQLQNQWVQQMPPPPAQPMPGHPPWGAPQPHYAHPHYYKKRGLMGMLFSS
ncbi:zf-TFIIB domain-containing protein [Oligoflexus tunisiensis]|uniref:TFIIB-type zinc ribbon-containing protein n=1 Tax=Oligoflexus tunisiensis TaxID=708132 RepID=UPI00114CC256